MFYQSYSRIPVKLRQRTIFEPDDIGKSYIPQKKALNRLSKFDENIGIWLVKHYDLYLFIKLVYICILYLKVEINLL